MKRYALTTAQILIPVAILAWLLHKESAAIQRLVTRPKDISLLVASLACLLSATCLSFVRWFLLVRALDIPFSLREAFRLGFLGYLFNFVGPGAVGGDLFKAYSVAKQQTERRAEAIATILLDRMTGMFSLFVVATAAIAMGDFQLSELQEFLRLIVLVTVASSVMILLLLAPARVSNWFFKPLARLPLVGSAVTRIRIALDLYRQRRSWLFGIGAISIVIHISVAVSMHFADRSIHATTPSLSEHLIISPMATVASAAPVPGGLGTYELAMDYLFQKLPRQTLEQGQGLSVAVVYRMLTLIIAGIGLGYYFLNRQAVLATVSALEAEQHESHSDSPRFTKETDSGVVKNL